MYNNCYALTVNRSLMAGKFRNLVIKIKCLKINVLT